MRFIRSLIRLRHNPTLFLPITRGPLHGFYHFFTGYLMPLYFDRMQHPNRKMAVVDSTPFNHWFSYLPGPAPDILDRHKSLKITYKARLWGFASGYRIHAVSGWDKWTAFPKRPLARIAQALQADFSQNRSEDSDANYPIVVFGRGHTPEFYRDNLPERYGTAKRDIPNLTELAEALDGLAPTMLVDPVEHTPEQVFRKLQGARVIVAQHGAALTNILFAKPGTHVVEIAWPELESDHTLGMYRVLSEELGLNWQRPISQTERFEPVDVGPLVTRIAELIE